MSASPQPVYPGDFSQETLDQWAPFWIAGIKPLSTYELGAELEYSEREIAELSAAAESDSSLLGIDSHLTGMLVRRHMIKWELGRRRKWSESTSGREAHLRLADFAHDLKTRLELHIYLVHREGIDLKGRGKFYKGLCPFHPERTPSLVVWADHFYCFGCHQRGDVYDWLMITNRARNWRDAVAIIADYLGATMPLPASGPGGVMVR